MLFGGSIFAVFAALYYWWPKIFGKLLSEPLGKASFWLMFVGMNLTFFPMHFLGLLGMPRRIYTYHYGGAWEWYNLTSTIGSGIMSLGILVFAWNVLKTHRSGARAVNDPWLARHARVVHELAAAGAQLRQGSLRDQRAAAARPAPADRGGPCLSRAPAPGCG